MRYRVLSLICLLPLLVLAQADNPAMTAYREGDFKSAIPLLEAAVNHEHNNSTLRAAWLSALVYEGRVDEASDAADADAQDFPNSPEVIAARGEYAYYMGDMAAAEKLFKTAIKLKESTARALYGLSRLFRAASLYRTGRLLCMQAHQMDPDDALITQLWMTTLSPDKRKELLPPFMAAHPWFYKYASAAESTESEVNHELDGRKIFELDGEKREATIHLISILHDANHMQGVGIEFKIEDRRPLHLLLDTGASGILIGQRAVDKAGLNHLGTVQTWGIGDDGKRSAFAAVSETCEIGEIKYKNCLMRALEGKHNVGGDADGLIGADFFAGYLMHIDFQRRQLHLTPQPPRVPNPQGYDRVIPPEEKDFTPVFRAGNHLFIPTILNSEISGLFLLDTGASVSNIDSTFARLSTKIYGNSNIRIRGVSGEVKKVFQADKAVLQFAHYQQDNLGLIAFDLNNHSDHQDFRMAGILGIPVLSLFRMTLDYRNGLVKFEYILGEKKK